MVRALSERSGLGEWPIRRRLAVLALSLCSGDEASASVQKSYTAQLDCPKCAEMACAAFLVARAYA